CIHVKKSCLRFKTALMPFGFTGAVARWIQWQRLRPGERKVWSSKACNFRPRPQTKADRSSARRRGRGQLFGPATQRFLEACARFRGKTTRRGVVRVVGMFVHSLAQKTNLPAITTAPEADEQVEAQPEAFGPRQRLVQSLGLKPAGFLARGHDAAE